MSENEDSTLSEDSDAGTSRSHQKEDIFGKYEAKDYGICYGIDTDYTDDDDEDHHYSRKRASLNLGKFLLVELIDTYKRLSMKVYNIHSFLYGRSFLRYYCSV